jgi:hypothetical protein
LHIKAFVRRVITLISCQAQGFRFTTSYNTKNERYFANAHFTSQDILNEENGITTISDFEDEDPNYDNRQRLRYTDDEIISKGKRVFLDHFLG